MTTDTTTPDYRALGQARLDIVTSVKTEEEWDERWPEPSHPYPFTWGSCWKQCVEYRAADFAAEVGFFVDALSLPTNALWDDFAMFTSPDKAFFFAVAPATDEHPATPPASFKIQFMVEGIVETACDLEARGIVLEEPPTPYGQPGGPMHRATFRTPGGYAIELWGLVQENS